MKKNKTSKNWLDKKKRDPYFKKSQTLGYRSRSSFKLIELDKKFNFLRRNIFLLDLGSSPGGWSQVAAKKISNGKILAVDILPMEKINRVEFLKGNFQDETIEKKIFYFFNKKIDVIISDAAANTTGNKNLDSFRTGEICLKVINLAKQSLNADGVLVFKMFMGSIFAEINKKAKETFKKVVVYKPLSSKKESKEIYFYCKGI